MSDYCDCDDGEMPSVFEERDVMAARDPHRCDECCRAILPGESYRHIFGIWPTVDGAATYRTCAWCMDLELYLKAHIPCFCVMLGGLHECAQYAADDHPEIRDEVTAMLAEISARPRTPHEELPVRD